MSRSLGCFSLLLAFSINIASSAMARPLPYKLFVATNGNDAWSGNLAAPNADKTDGPLSTLAAARDRIRKLRKDGDFDEVGAEIIIRGGVYCLPETLKLGPEDSGNMSAGIRYEAYENEKPILMGAKPLAGWMVHKDKILKTNVNEQGFKGIYFRQLFFDGARQHLARYPNFDPQNPYGGGWAYADGKPVPMYAEVPGETRRDFNYRQQDERTWSRPDELEVFVFARYNWWNNIVRVKAVDHAARHITLAADASYAIRPLDRYYVRNALEELDAPGEWYLDKKDGTLYFWPPVGGNSVADRKSATELPPTKVVYAPHLRTIVELKGVKCVDFTGITFENCEGTAVELKDCEHCSIEACTIRNVGDYHGSGVSVFNGKENRVVGCDISNTGSHGVSLSGGDRIKLVPGGNEAVNNYIHHVGVYYKQGVGVSMSGCGNRAAHNLIHDGPRMGIMFSGNNLILEYNHIRHVNLETEDTGAVYTGGRDWISSRGTVIRHNYFHDILGYGRVGDRWTSPHFAWGVYLDDNTGGVDVIGNIVVRAFRAGLHLHNGRDNLIENNIFVDAKQQQIEYNGWTETHRMWKDHLPTMIKGYESVMGEPAWKAMRNMDVHPTKAVLPDGRIMSGNVLKRNIICYREPQAKLFNLKNADLQRNTSDYNLVWHYGLPLLTGLKAAKPIGPNLLANAGFEEGKPGEMPAKWHWQQQPKDAKAGSDTAAAAGKQSLRIDCVEAKDAKGKSACPIIVSTAVEAKPGQTFRLTAKMKADKPGVKATLMGQSHISNVYFWHKMQAVVVGPEWKEYDFSFTLPREGEPGFHAQMKTVAARFDLASDHATLWIDEAALTEAELLDEWQAWQAAGNDRNSVAADPLFVNADKDDYRLQPHSPALKLGFKPIPVEKIGPQKDQPRATWPIVEAEGAREKPLE